MCKTVCGKAAEETNGALPYTVSSTYRHALVNLLRKLRGTPSCSQHNLLQGRFELELTLHTLIPSTCALWVSHISHSRNKRRIYSE